jgi:hypothetical protein
MKTYKIYHYPNDYTEVYKTDYIDIFEIKPDQI